jgi:hypothetical protein
MRIEGRTPGFKMFECPKCAFIVVEVEKECAREAKS